MVQPTQPCGGAVHHSPKNSQAKYSCFNYTAELYYICQIDWQQPGAILTPIQCGWWKEPLFGIYSLLRAFLFINVDCEALMGEHNLVMFKEERISWQQSSGRNLLVFTARCTLVQSAVLRSHVVCLSVCNVGGLWSHRLEYIRNNFTIS